MSQSIVCLHLLCKRKIFFFIKLKHRRCKRAILIKNDSRFFFVWILIDKGNFFLLFRFIFVIFFKGRFCKNAENIVLEVFHPTGFRFDFNWHCSLLTLLFSFQSFYWGCSNTNEMSLFIFFYICYGFHSF